MSTRIREVRKRRRMTLQQLAELVGTTAQTIQRLETDNMTVSIDWLTRIAAALEVKAGELLADRQLRRLRYLGDVDGQGAVSASGLHVDPSFLEIDVPGTDPVAVKVMGKLGPYEGGTILIADRLDDGDLARADGRDCLVALAGGDVLFRRIVSSERSPTAFVPYSDNAPVERDLDIVWLAPVVMAVRYTSGHQP
jgi:transcriptional regulator with XRE-family HTH domain